MKKAKKNQAMTLVEMIIVVALIGLIGIAVTMNVVTLLDSSEATRNALMAGNDNRLALLTITEQIKQATPNSISFSGTPRNYTTVISSDPEVTGTVQVYPEISFIVPVGFDTDSREVVWSNDPDAATKADAEHHMLPYLPCTISFLLNDKGQIVQRMTSPDGTTQDLPRYMAAEESSLVDDNDDPLPALGFYKTTDPTTLKEIITVMLTTEMGSEERPASWQVFTSSTVVAPGN